eukprot:29282-Pelagococcus_subviridis.AAC.11
MRSISSSAEPLHPTIHVSCWGLLDDPLGFVSDSYATLNSAVPPFLKPNTVNCSYDAAALTASVCETLPIRASAPVTHPSAMTRTRTRRGPRPHLEREVSLISEAAPAASEMARSYLWTRHKNPKSSEKNLKIIDNSLR